MADWARFTAAGFGSGWLPKAPGTWGSAVSLIPGYLLLEYLGKMELAVATVLISLLGFYVCYLVLPRIDEKDPGWIVIDEWAGQWLCLLICAFFVGNSLWAVGLSFALFRFFDVLKPWPVAQMEDMGAPWWGIMVDDLAAGLFGGMICGMVVMLGYSGGQL